MLGNVSTNHQAFNTQKAYQSSSMEANVASSRKTTGEKSSFMDKVTLQGESTTALTYTNSMKIGGEAGARFEMLQKLVTNLLMKQGVDTKVMMGDQEADLASITPDDAQQLISEDGYFGVEQTSERIFQFAVGSAAGDPSRLETVKQGIEKGFQEAKDAFGGWLPDISYETLDAVMEKLDKWASEN